MLKKDKENFLKFISRDAEQVTAAVQSFNQYKNGHFEDHPMSQKFVKEHLDELLFIWDNHPSEENRIWVLQFLADAEVVDQRVKPIVLAALKDKNCRVLPTILYLMGTEKPLFEDCGESLLALATHHDLEVRWRVAWLISGMKSRSPEMIQAINILKNDTTEITQVYVKLCGG